MAQSTNFQTIGQPSHDNNFQSASAQQPIAFTPLDVEGAYSLAVADLKKQLDWIRFHALKDPDELIILSRWRLTQFLEAAEALFIAADMMQPIYTSTRLTGGGVPLEQWKETASLAFQFRKLLLEERRDKEAILDAWEASSTTDSQLLVNLVNSRK